MKKVLVLLVLVLTGVLLVGCQSKGNNTDAVELLVYSNDIAILQRLESLEAYVAELEAQIEALEAQLGE